MSLLKLPSKNIPIGTSPGANILSRRAASAFDEVDFTRLSSKKFRTLKLQLSTTYSETPAQYKHAFETKLCTPAAALSGRRKPSCQEAAAQWVVVANVAVYLQEVSS